MVCLPPAEGGNVGDIPPLRFSCTLWSLLFSFIFRGIVGKLLMLSIIGQFVWPQSSLELMLTQHRLLLSRPDLNQDWFRVDHANTAFCRCPFQPFYHPLKFGKHHGTFGRFFWDPELDSWLLVFLSCVNLNLFKNPFLSILGNQRVQVLLFFEADGLVF